MGSWVTYGLGTENADLPGFITICPTLAHGGVNNWSSAFLPAAYQGTAARATPAMPSDQARVRYIDNPTIAARRAAGPTRPARRDEPRPPGGIPAPTRRSKGGSTRSSWPSACRRPCPRSKTSPSESAATRRAVRPRRPDDRRLRPAMPAGPAVRRARRAVRPGHAQRHERAVGPARRPEERPRQERPARSTGPIAGLLSDLKVRGLLDDTLVLWGGEFGRTPTAARDRRPRPQSRGLHHVAGRRRREARLSPRRDRRLRLFTPSRTRSTSTTCTPRSCTCSAWTTSG